jgi:hypothetical protein
VSSLVEDIEYLDILSFEETNTSIYQPLNEPPILTVIIGAKCSDGIALIADTKYTDIILGKESFDKKVFGDIAHLTCNHVVTLKSFCSNTRNSAHLP